MCLQVTPPPPHTHPNPPFAPHTLFSENERLGLRNKGERGQMGFMQKCGPTVAPASFTHPPRHLLRRYYHKGSYFMDDAQVKLALKRTSLRTSHAR
jgi:hypothetical protein